MADKRWLTVLAVVLGGIALCAVLVSLSHRLALMDVHPFTLLWKEATPTPKPDPVIVGRPVEAPTCELVDWHKLAIYIERVSFVDVITMGERNGTAFASLCLDESSSEDGIAYIGQLAIEALSVFGDVENEYIAISFVLEPVGDDPRYRLMYGLVCKVTAGEIWDCDGSSLGGGYLSQESVQWPGRE